MKYHQWILINEEYDNAGNWINKHKCSRCLLEVNTEIVMFHDETIMRRDQEWNGDCDLSIIKQIHEL